MPKLRRLSGRETISFLESVGFVRVSQRGTHVKLRRVSGSGEKQTLHVPDHREVDTGTSLAIFKQASKYIDEAELRRFFYAD